jgi:hypothetical protein
VALRIIQFLAVVLTALALVPLGAHLASLPNKINLAAEQYSSSKLRTAVGSCSPSRKSRA